MRIFVGGLPQHPEPPLNYMLVYSLEGALDYYTTLSWVLRDGKRTQVKALSEREPVEFDAPVGELEAFHTAGGLSTMAFRYEGKIPTMEYKTLRYPGTRGAHGRRFASSGLLDLEPVDVKGMKVVPRDVFIASVRPKLTKPKGRDLVALRVVVAGTKGGKPATTRFELVDRYDEKHDISAMMRTTGYSLSITGLMQVRGEVDAAGRAHAGRMRAGAERTSPSCGSAGSTSKNPEVRRDGTAAVSAAHSGRYAGHYSRTNSAIVAPIWSIAALAFQRSVPL